MGNIISVNKKTSDECVLSMSDQGTDCFLKLIIGCAKLGEMTGSQMELIEYLDDIKYKNGYASETVSFDIDEKVIGRGVAVFSAAVLDLMKGSN
jgi:hypothetical protein